MAGETRHNGDALGSALRDEHDFPELRAVAQGIVRRALASEGTLAAATRALGIGRNQLGEWVRRWPELHPDYQPATEKKRQGRSKK